MSEGAGKSRPSQPVSLCFRQIFVELIECPAKSLLHGFPETLEDIAFLLGRVDRPSPQVERRLACVLGERQRVQYLQRPVGMIGRPSRPAFFIRKRIDENDPLRRRDLTIRKFSKTFLVRPAVASNSEKFRPAEDPTDRP